MSNAPTLYEPTGYYEYLSTNLVFIIRIVTTLTGIGNITLDGQPVSPLVYRRVPDSLIYYYETITTNATHMIRAIDTNTKFTVIICSLSRYLIILV
jgi:hypothetical protein